MESSFVSSSELIYHAASQELKPEHYSGHLPKRFGEPTEICPPSITNICRTCNHVVENDERSVVALGRRWHVEHFVCKACAAQIGENSFLEHENGIVCIPCYNANFAPRCHRCNGPCTEESLSALGRHYHNACFRCWGCASDLNRVPYFELQGRAFCQECAARSRQSERSRWILCSNEKMYVSYNDNWNARLAVGAELTSVVVLGRSLLVATTSTQILLISGCGLAFDASEISNIKVSVLCDILACEGGDGYTYICDATCRQTLPSMRMHSFRLVAPKVADTAPSTSTITFVGIAATGSFVGQVTDLVITVRVRLRETLHRSPSKKGRVRIGLLADTKFNDTVAIDVAPASWLPPLRQGNSADLQQQPCPTLETSRPDAICVWSRAAGMHLLNILDGGSAVLARVEGVDEALLARGVDRSLLADFCFSSREGELAAIVGRQLLTEIFPGDGADQSASHAHAQVELPEEMTRITQLNTSATV